MTERPFTRQKNRVRTCQKSNRRLWPQTQKKHGSVPILQNMVRIVYTGKNVRSVLLFGQVRTRFFYILHVFDQTWGRNEFEIFSGFENSLRTKKHHHVSRLTIGYLWGKCENFLILIMCHIFPIFPFNWLYSRTADLLTYSCRRA